jgi:phospholipase C
MPGTGRMDKVEHVVVLMLENRSFDHVLGFLEGPGLDPVTDADAIPIDPTEPGSPLCAPYRASKFEHVEVDPRHDYPEVMSQLTGRSGPWKPLPPLTNNGFVWNYVKHTSPKRARELMACFTDKQIPATWALARAFAVCSRWFCSLPSQTWPNRLFAHAATSDNTVDLDVRWYTNPTIFEALGPGEWKAYVGDVAQVMAFKNLLWRPGEDNFGLLDDFYDDAREGRLRRYSYVEPRHLIGSNSQHPCQNIGRGDRLVRKVYEAVSANEETWNSVLLLITYDEHGGFFDRVAPDRATPPTKGAVDPRYLFEFDLLGPRVPTIVVSPYVREDRRADDRTYDHSSIVKTVRNAFGIEEALTDRDRDADDVLHLLELDEPRTAPSLPPPSGELEIDLADDDPEEWAEGVTPDGFIRTNDFQSSLLQLARLLEKDKPSNRPELVRPDSVPDPPFRSPQEVVEFVKDFQERHVRHS